MPGVAVKMRRYVEEHRIVVVISGTTEPLILTAARHVSFPVKLTVRMETDRLMMVSAET